MEGAVEVEVEGTDPQVFAQDPSCLSDHSSFLRALVAKPSTCRTAETNQGMDKQSLLYPTMSVIFRVAEAVWTAQTAGAIQQSPWKGSCWEMGILLTACHQNNEMRGKRC